MALQTQIHRASQESPHQSQLSLLQWQWAYQRPSFSDTYGQNLIQEGTTRYLLWSSSPTMAVLGFSGDSAVKNLPAVLETQVQSLHQEDPLEKETATHSCILAWEIPWTEEPGGLCPWGYKETLLND